MTNICFLDYGTMGSDTDPTPLERFGSLTLYDHTPPEETASRISGCSIVISNKVVLNREVLTRSPGVKLICVAATGTNNVDIEACRELGIAVTNVAGYSTRSVAQHTFALLLSLLENMYYYQSYTRSGDWARNLHFPNLNHSFYEIEGKRWGIIGLGAIGMRTAQLAQAFGCEVVYYSASGMNHSADYPRMDLPELMQTCDIVSVHAPLTDRTRSLIDYNHLAMMKPEALVINVGRGGIVNEADMRDALNEGLLRGFAADVLESNPTNPECPLLEVRDPSKLVLTPHIAWGSKEARIRLVEELERNIASFLDDTRRNRLD